jgi:putative ABC transport system permease protein
VLDDAPQARIAVARLPAQREQETQDALASAYPNVTMLRIREVLERVVAVLERVGLAIRILGGFTVLTGIAILVGVVSAASARRGREVALLKTLGMTRRGVAGVFSVEYALIGLVSGAIGAAGAVALAGIVLTQGMEIPFVFEPLPVAVAVAGNVVVAVVAGIAASAGALARRPVEVLRSAE